MITKVEKTHLLAHFDDNIRITAHDIPDSKIDTSFNMNSQQTQQVLHGEICEEMKKNGIFQRESKWLYPKVVSKVKLLITYELWTSLTIYYYFIFS